MKPTVKSTRQSIPVDRKKVEEVRKKEKRRVKCGTVQYSKVKQVRVEENKLKERRIKLVKKRNKGLIGTISILLSAHLNNFHSKQEDKRTNMRYA